VDGDEGVRLTIGRIEPVSARLPLARFTQRPLSDAARAHARPATGPSMTAAAGVSMRVRADGRSRGFTPHQQHVRCVRR